MKRGHYLDTEAMKLGYHQMLKDVLSEIRKNELTEAIRVIMIDRKSAITERLKSLEGKQ